MQCKSTKWGSGSAIDLLCGLRHVSFLLFTSNLHLNNKSVELNDLEYFSNKSIAT